MATTNKTSPGRYSANGGLIVLIDPYGLRRPLDYVFDRNDGPGAVIVLRGWYDRYGGRGCASNILRGEIEHLENGGWKIGDNVLLPNDGDPYTPALTRDSAREYAQSDTLADPGE